MVNSLLKNYIALIVVIVLWVAVWSISDSLSKIYLKNHSNKIIFYGLVLAISSFVLIYFFPENMSL